MVGKLLREAIFIRDKHKCSVCGKNAHMVARMDTTRPETDADNIISLCYDCFRYKRQDWIVNIPPNHYKKLARKNLRWECWTCGTKRNLEIHHIDGNHENNTLDNLMVLCRNCHIRRHRRMRLDEKVAQILPNPA